MRLPGLERREWCAWAFYDWAQSAAITVIGTAVFPVYFAQIVATAHPPAERTQLLALANGIALVVVAALAPVLGAVADARPWKKRFLAGALGLGVIGCVALAHVAPGRVAWALAAFVLVMVGATGSFVFYEALLPHLAQGPDLDRVSGAGYALGYIGGGLLLAGDLLLLARPEWFGLAREPGLPIRLVFLSVAVWWLVFSVPLWRRVPEPQAAPVPGAAPIATAWRRVRATAREIRRYPMAFLFLLAFFLYNDGIQTIIRLATAYGSELGLGRDALVGAVLLVQFVGVPFAFAFGSLGARWGPKRGILLALAVYVVVTAWGYRLRTATDFFVLAFLVATVQGGAQALSRSLFARLIPAERSGEFFGFYGVMEKFAGLLGPFLFAAAIELTGSSRRAILALIVLFAAGGLLLARVDVAGGARQAGHAEPSGR